MQVSAVGRFTLASLHSKYYRDCFQNKTRGALKSIVSDFRIGIIKINKYLSADDAQHQQDTR